MKCEAVQQQIVLAVYGELPDELAGSLERHLKVCDACSREVNALRALDEDLALHPVAEPSPNLLAQSRMRLDEALDLLPPHGLLTRFRVSVNRWLSVVETAPALMTLLVGVGFLTGNFTVRYQAAHTSKPVSAVAVSKPAEGGVASITGISRTSNPEIVQVRYNRVVPETMEGSLDSQGIRQLLLAGTTEAANSDVRESSVNLLSNECRVGHSCTVDDGGQGLLGALLVLLRYDRSPGVRLKALEGLQPYVGRDQRVRDVILEALMHDKSEAVRKAAIGLLSPVHSDSSVRQVLRTVSVQDVNPYIRTASFQALRDDADIE